MHVLATWAAWLSLALLIGHGHSQDIVDPQIILEQGIVLNGDPEVCLKEISRRVSINGHGQTKYRHDMRASTGRAHWQ